MLKTKFVFSPVVVNRYYRNVFSVKKTAFRNIKNAIVSYGKMSIAISLASLLNFSAEAQCNTFKNADAANPLLSVIPAGKRPSGLDFVDIDGDNDLDCYVRFDADRKFTFYRNIGNARHPVFTQDSTTGFGNYVLPFNRYTAFDGNQYMQFADIDGDGDLDFFITGQNNIYYGTARIKYFENTGDNKVPKFSENEAGNPLAFAYSSYYVPFKLADIDGDGDYDLYFNDNFRYGNYGYPNVYINDGTRYVPHYVLYTNNACNCADKGRTYCDWNHDGLLDYFTVKDGSYFGEYNFSYFHKNIGPKEAPVYIDDNKNKPKFENGVPYRMVDLNNDGAPEVFNATGHYSTLAPVAVIEDTVIKNGSKTFTVLSSKNRGVLYRWEYNGTTIPGADKYYVVARQAGTYTLYVTGNCGTGVSLDYTIPKNGMPAEQANDRITAMKNAITAPFAVTSYPNPFTHTFTLQLSASDAQTESRIKITDLTGSVFLSQQMSASSVQVGQRLPRGTYIVQVWQKGELVYHTIMMKQ